MFKFDIEDGVMSVMIDKDIDNNIGDISELLRIHNVFLNSDCTKIILFFTECNYIDAAVSVIIGTFPEYARLHHKKVNFRFPNRQNPILKFMKQIGMYEYYTKINQYKGDDIIPFNRIKDESMMDEYTEKIMTLAPIKMQKEAQDILSSYIYEIYQNDLFHSKSEIGVYTSGIWLPDKKEFHFSVYDMGTGIPANIRQTLNIKDLDSEKCVKIAFIDGFSTSKEKGVNRGLGLTRLKSFINLNNGSMSMYTDDLCYCIDESHRETYKKLSTPIIGTLIIINIVADENNIYIVEKEKKHD